MQVRKPICSNDFLLTLSKDEFEDVGNLLEIKTYCRWILIYTTDHSRSNMSVVPIQHVYYQMNSKVDMR